MEWFGRGVGSGAPLFPGRLETKSGPGAAASAASEPKAEACTATLSQAESLPSHPFSDAQGAEDPQGQGQRLGSYILCLEICVNHNISPKCEKCGKPLCRAGGNKNKIPSLDPKIAVCLYYPRSQYSCLLTHEKSSFTFARSASFLRSKKSLQGFSTKNFSKQEVCLRPVSKHHRRTLAPACNHPYNAGCIIFLYTLNIFIVFRTYGTVMASQSFNQNGRMKI